MKRRWQAWAMASGLALASPAWADPAPFDLAGPDLKITVTRQGTTLPIGAVPQLASGDRLHIEARLPANETAHYVLVVASLRDPTNPPPDDWFARSETWKRPGHGGGPLEITVPADARHVVVYMAPATGGDFSTLRDAVKGRPGAFVRAAQDLEQASLDRARYDAYLAAVRKQALLPGTLSKVAPVLAESLRIKINEECLQRQAEFQAACLLDAKQSVVLGNDDASSTNALVGAATDLALSLSSTPAGGLGYYSPYISTIHELIGIFSAMHTAKYQYIPALGVLEGERLRLVLNTPPSFANPKSVLMAALPPVKAANPPVPQRPAEAPPLCYGAKAPVLTLSANPLFYATGYARDLMLRVRLPDASKVDVPLSPEAGRGGFVVGAMPAAQGLSGALTGAVRGQWGFGSFVGPEVNLVAAGGWHWQAADSAHDKGTLVFAGGPSACVAGVTIHAGHGKVQAAAWRADGPDKIVVTPPPADDRPEALEVEIAGPESVVPAKVVVAAPVKLPPPPAAVTAHDFALTVGDSGPAIGLDSADEIPAGARLSMTIKAVGDVPFSDHDTLEIGATNASMTAHLTLGGGLTLVDSHVLVATLTPAQALGASAYGTLRARLVRGGVPGDWMNVGKLVRLPHVHGLDCPNETAAPCVLSGEALYLLASVSAERSFETAASIAEGYPGFSLKVPHPGADGLLYVRLHDAPEVINHIVSKPSDTATKSL